MATIRLKAEGGIARYLKSPGPETDVEMEAGETVRAVLGRLGIPATAAALILVNGEASSAEHALAPGDRVVLLPLIVGG